MYGMRDRPPASEGEREQMGERAGARASSTGEVVWERGAAAARAAAGLAPDVKLSKQPWCCKA